MTLHVLATPIGNLGDLSPRAREVLVAADLLVAEDSRRARRLLSAIGLPAPRILSLPAHDEDRRAEQLAEEVARVQVAVLTSDAGTPGVSDPGATLVAACHARGVAVRAVPGPSAAAAALSVSGLPGVPAHLLGFPPRRPGPLRRWLRWAGGLEGTLVLYEAPGRLVATAAAVAEVLPDRVVCLCRELTKVHEEVIVAGAGELARRLAGREAIRGEAVLVVGPGRPPAPQAPPERVGRIASVLARRWGVDRREVYKGLVALEEALAGGGRKEKTSEP